MNARVFAMCMTFNVCFVCGPAEAASVEENLASCLGELVTAKVKEALADEPGEIFCCC